MAGSFVVHAFAGSGLYAFKTPAPEGWSGVSIETEFKAQGPRKPIEVSWFFGDRLRDTRFEVDPIVVPTTTGGGANGDLLGDRKRTTIAKLAKETGMSTRAIRRIVEADDRLGVREMGSRKSPMVYRINTNGDSP
jgi:hypothetical protein